MKTLSRILCFAVFIVMIFSTVGAYAMWTFTGPVDDTQDSVQISLGMFEYKPFEGVYISKAEVYTTNRVTNLACELSHPTNIYSSVRANSGGSITYKVTFHNNSSTNFWFINQNYDSGLGDNSLINGQNGITIMTKDHPGDSSATFNSDDWIPANTYRDVYITYTFGSNAINERITFVDYQFGVKIDSVYSSFEGLLNSTGEGSGYDLLSKAFDEIYAETGSVVIANVGEDKELFDKLFGGDITITIDGKEVPVTIMIRREDVDGKATGDAYENGPSGCEYTMYITIDQLDPNENSSGNVTVYAVTYSQGGISSQDGWYQVGELYEGTAPLKDYGDGDVFDYAEWQASEKEYVVADGITYVIGKEQGDQYQKMKDLEDLMSVRDNEIFNKINNTGILKRVYAIVYNQANVGKPGHDILKQAFENAAPFYTINNNGGDIPVNTNCTRAEILPYIEAIQHALDYYNQVN